MEFKARYRFWHVLLAVLMFGILFAIGSRTSGGAELSEEAARETGGFRSGLRYGLCFLYVVAFFYFALNYYYNLVAANKKFRSFLRFTATIILISFTYHAFLFYYLPEALSKKYGSLPDVWCASMQKMIPMLLLSYLFAYVTNMREALTQRRILEAQKLQLEMEKAQANFNFLKAQINPHFLHNTLNFLYAKSLPYSAELSEGILTLSDIMRYALDQAGESGGKTPLKDEIEHVKNVIKINQLRFSNELSVNFEVNGPVNGAMIVPFVLITLVENAFKHGDLKNPEHPLDIRLDVQGNRLYFYCRNKKKSGPKELSTGIGLENVKKRLELSYGTGYTLLINDEPGFYTTELTIDQL